MSEIINTYDLNDLEAVIPMDRDEFYKEQVAAFKKTGAPTKANEVVNVFIFNSNRELLIQKRSFGKAHNAGLLDKSVGGHVRYGDTPDYTVMVETVQELQTPSIVLRSKDDFKKTVFLLNDYLTTISIVRHSVTKTYVMEKVMENEKVKIANKIHLYFGIYDGSVRPVDREAKGILFYSLEELDKEMSEFPDTFTYDMHLFLKELRPELEEFLTFLQTAGK